MKALAIASIAQAIFAQAFAVPQAWDELSDAEKDKAVATIELYMANPGVTPNAQHESWLAMRLDEGWTHADVPDLEAKKHPLCLPYGELPELVVRKDAIFYAAAIELGGIADSDELLVEIDSLKVKLNNCGACDKSQSPVIISSPVHGVMIQYIGSREAYRDRIHGTGLEWVSGQSRVLPLRIARKLLINADLFVEVASPADSLLIGDDTESVLAQSQAQQQAQRDKELDLASLQLSVAQMDKASLIEYGARYGVRLAKNATGVKVEEARASILTKIEQFGVV